MTKGKLRVGIVGAGRWSAAVHLPALAADGNVEIIAVCDSDLDRAQTAARLFNIPLAVRDVSVLADAGLDCAIIATPHDQHFGPASALIASGADVLVEKPLTIDPAEAWALVSAAERARVQLHVGYTFLHSPIVEQLAREIAANRLGVPRLITGVFASAAGRLFGGQTEAVPGEPVAPLASTYADPTRGGGQLYAQLTHAISLVLHVSGLMAKTVTGQQILAPSGVDLVDVVAMDLGTAAAGLSTTGTVAARNHGVERYDFFGDNGHAELDTHSGSLRFIDYISGLVEIVNVSPQVANPIAMPVLALLESRRLGTPAPVGGDIGARTVEVLDAIARSVRSGMKEAVNGRPDGSAAEKRSS